MLLWFVLYAIISIIAFGLFLRNEEESRDIMPTTRAALKAAFWPFMLLFYFGWWINRI